MLIKQHHFIEISPATNFTWNRYASPNAVDKQNMQSRFGCSGIACMIAPSTIIKCFGVASTDRPSRESQGQKSSVVPFKHTQYPFHPLFLANSTQKIFRQNNYQPNRNHPLLLMLNDIGLFTHDQPGASSLRSTS